MIIEKGVCYGRTTQEVRKLGYPEDNQSNIKVDNVIILTGEEVSEMFPNQHLVLKVIEFKDINALSNFKKAIVLFFKCEGHFASDMVKRLRKEDPKGIYFSATYYDPVLEGDLLWF